MRWSYKTVHYALKKEGLLGSAFLDESEVEQSLNEYGKAGWELVSLLETMDGVIGVFKQPLSVDQGSFVAPPKPVAKSVQQAPVVEKAPADDGVSEEHDIFIEESEPGMVTLEEYELEEEQDVKKSPEPLKVDVGSIRIE